ncbi:MAG: hypothetical protein K2Q18_03880 [Bdellovibrionales bacterium]|nr:hypothetical protein [Bdellovibrionales bacterium]
MRHLIVLSIFFLSLVLSKKASALIVDNNLGRQINFSHVEVLLKLPKKELINEIQKQGVRIILNDSKEKDVNEIFENLHFTNKEEMQKLGYYYPYPKGEAEFMSSNDPDNELNENVIIISNNANTLTAIHEYMHYISYQQLTPELQKFSAIKRWEAARSERRMRDRFDRIMRNTFYLQETLWRQDMVNALDDFTNDLGPAIAFGMSEEIVIERALSRMVATDNLYYDKERLQNGLQYSETTWANILVKIRDLKFLNDWLIGEIISLEDLVDEEEKADVLTKQKIFEERTNALADIYVNIGKILK